MDANYLSSRSNWLSIFAYVSIEYWFRCLDLDGDGYISMYEMEYFYEEQMTKLEQLDIEPLPFEDCICQVFSVLIKSLIPERRNGYSGRYVVAATHRSKAVVSNLAFATPIELKPLL